MMTGIQATIRGGYTGYDHLIDDSDRRAATDAVAGVSFRRSADAHRAAERAFLESCDRRVRGARVSVEIRNGRGDVIEIG